MILVCPILIELRIGNIQLNQFQNENSHYVYCHFEIYSNLKYIIPDLKLRNLYIIWKSVERSPIRLSP